MAQNVTVAGASYSDVPAVQLPKTGGGSAMFYDASGIDYASSPTSGGNANKTNAILYGTVDSTSTATAFTATVEGLTELVDGTCVMLHNGVVTSATNFTVNINGLGAKPCYNNLTNATRDTTIFNVAYTMLFVYAESLNSGNGGWWIYRGYDANTNTIGYQLRGNSATRNVSDTARYYKLYFTSADDTMWVPASVNSVNNAAAAKPVNQRPIDPFGPIVYTSANTNYTAGSNLAAATAWQQYALTLGHSFNRTGAALELTVKAPVYVKCAPQANGSAIMDADTPIVQALPSTKDGKIYIYLGIAYSATAIELVMTHPVYWHDGTGIRLWTGAEPSSGSSVDPATATPLVDGTAAVGSSAKYAREDHVHPTDTSRQATLVSGTNIKTVNNESLLGSGNISTPTYTLPTASTSTLGGVKVDGSTITISDGVISSAGGGGFSKLTLYTDGNRTNLWVDSARTETLLEHYGYDLHAARDDFLSSDIIVVIYAGNMFSVLGWEIDTVDEDFYVKVFDGTVSGKLVNNGTTITFAKAKVISVS